MSSKYQKKQDGKKPFKGKKGGKGAKPKAPVVIGAPVYLYTSTCCEAPTTKTPCLRDRDVELKDRKATLGTWKCSKCRKKAKVSRKLNKEGLKQNELLKDGSGPNREV